MATLRFWFSAPFRTRVTFDSSVLEWCPDAARNAFAHAAEAIAAAVGDACTVPASSAHADPEHRYATLSEDADQHFVTPVLEIRAPEALRDTLARAVLGAGSLFEAGNPRIDPQSTNVVLFDNSIAILEWGLLVDCDGDGEAALLEAVGTAAFNASSAAVAWIQRELMPVVVPEIDRGFRRYDVLPGWPRFLLLPTGHTRLLRRLSRALRRPRQATAFFDMPDKTGGNGLMWVSRVLVCGPEDAGPAALEWVGGASEEDGDGLRAGIGNSLLLEWHDGERADLVAAYRKMQYLYALLDVHGRNISRLSTGFLARREAILSDTLLRLERIQSHLSVVESRVIDVFAGLQGRRARYCAALSRAWDFTGKQQGVHRKAQIAKEMVERFARAQSMKYQKIVQLILAGVGVLALADVVINITAFSQTVGDDATWGIVKAVRSVAPDSLLTGTGIVLSVSIVILALLFRKG